MKKIATKQSLGESINIPLKNQIAILDSYDLVNVEM